MTETPMEQMEAHALIAQNIVENNAEHIDVEALNGLVQEIKFALSAAYSAALSSRAPQAECKHENKRGNGTVSSDGSSHIEWTCTACGHREVTSSEASHAPQAGWRCYHCDKTFAGQAAEEHFGTYQHDAPLCIAGQFELREIRKERDATGDENVRLCAEIEQLRAPQGTYLKVPQGTLASPAECSCDWATGECQAPTGCKALSSRAPQAGGEPSCEYPLCDCVIETESFSGFKCPRGRELKQATPADEPKGLHKRPVAWRVRLERVPERWVIYQDEEVAYTQATQTDAEMQGLYVRDGTPNIFSDEPKGSIKEWCGFCGKHGKEVEQLIEGPTVAVCNECIELLHGLLPIADEPKGDVPSVDVAAEFVLDLLPDTDDAGTRARDIAAVVLAYAANPALADEPDDPQYIGGTLGTHLAALLARKAKASKGDVRRALSAQFGKIATALGFFASAIKSGDDWTETCERAKKEAFDALTEIGAALSTPSQDEGEAR